MKYIVDNEQDWHKLRAQVVTASEAAVLVGADPYSSPKAIREPSTFTGNAFTLVGQLLEPIVVKSVNKVLGTNFELYETSDGTREFYMEGCLGATPDAHQDRKMLLECKTVNAKTYLKYSSVPPNKYLIQLIVQGICTRLDKSDHYLALLNTKLKTMKQYEEFLKEPNLDQDWEVSIYRVKQNEELCSILKSEAERFMAGKQFRVSSKLKQKVKLLLAMGIERC